MITVKAGDREVRIYSSIKEMPIKRHKLMQQYLLQEAGIGSNISDIDQHLSKVAQFVGADKKDEAVEELANLRYNFFSLMTGLSFRSKAFCCLMDCEIEEGVRLVDEMSEGDVTDTWESVKKNLILNYQHTSPDGSEAILSTLRT
ncbi:MAG: hypothetical protein JNK14_05820 [Chitinophagaceae bacterium]|nr:hypothetical protein [Chitinophagaceae bacterium]